MGILRKDFHAIADEVREIATVSGGMTDHLLKGDTGERLIILT